MLFNFINQTNIPTKKILDVNAGSSCGYYLDQSSYLWGWGIGSSLPDGIGTSQSVPTQGIADRPYARLCEGGIALDASSYAWSWGTNAYGQLGNNTTINIPAPVSIAGSKRWRDIQGQYNVRCGLDLSSYAWAWGLNVSGTCGDNTTANRSSPVSVVGGKQFISITEGFSSNGEWCNGLDSSSYAWAWGYNSNGQLGNYSTLSSSSPISVVGNKQWRVILSTQHTSTYDDGCVIALDSSSYAWSWGTNGYGEAGVAQYFVGKSSPVSVHGPWDNIYHLSGASFLGVLNGAYYVWGGNSAGQLGINSILDVFSPTLVQYPFTVKKIVGTGGNNSSSSATYAIDTKDTLWSWGYNGTGQLGNNTIINASYPARPLDKDKMYGVYTYSHPDITSNLHTAGAETFTTKGYLFLDNSSYAWTWGNNTYGALGNGTNLGISSPQSVVGNIRFKQIHMTPVLTTGVDISGYGWAWGYNPNGQLGDNTTANRSSPVSVIGDKRWIKIINSGNMNSPANAASFGIDESSYVWTWGNNIGGQLGDNSSASSSSPVSVVGGRQALDIAAVLSTALMLDSSSYVWAWGVKTAARGDINSMGFGVSSPVSVVGGKQFIKISIANGSSGAVSVGLDSSSYLWAWGAFCGDNTVVAKSSPVSVVGNRQFIGLAQPGMANWMFAIDASSYAWVWGTFGGFGSGDGTNISRSSPVSVVGGNQFTRIINNDLTTVGSTSTGPMAWGAVGTNGYNFPAASIATLYPISVYPSKHTYIVSPAIVKKNIFGQY